MRIMPVVSKVPTLILKLNLDTFPQILFFADASLGFTIRKACCHAFYYESELKCDHSEKEDDTLLVYG